MSRQAPQFAYVLHQWAWSETSLILDLFTREQGRIAAVAKGAKRPYSQLRPVLLPFQRLQVLMGRPKADDASDVLTLRSADYAGAGAVLPPARLMSGFYCNELLLKLLARSDPHEQLFDAYADTLQALAAGDDDETPLRAFELQLLRACGLLPELDRSTLTQERVAPGGSYQLRPEAGLVAVADGAGAATLSGAQCRALQAALDGGSGVGAIAGAALRDATRPALAALKLQLRGLLHYHLGSPQLRTRQLMLDVRRLLDTPSRTDPPPGPP
jgi:DNA repair protein RecO (recombination protein O)